MKIFGYVIVKEEQIKGMQQKIDSLTNIIEKYDSEVREYALTNQRLIEKNKELEHLVEQYKELLKKERDEKIALYRSLKR
jgi:SMC interacting uncharacterized protein involved in chromosome segregation